MNFHQDQIKLIRHVVRLHLLRVCVIIYTLIFGTFYEFHSIELDLVYQQTIQKIASYHSAY